MVKREGQRGPVAGIKFFLRPAVWTVLGECLGLDKGRATSGVSQRVSQDLYYQARIYSRLIIAMRKLLVILIVVAIIGCALAEPEPELEKRGFKSFLKKFWKKVKNVSKQVYDKSLSKKVNEFGKAGVQAARTKVSGLIDIAHGKLTGKAKAGAPKKGAGAAKKLAATAAKKKG
ncbi:hypothetical protein ElyMa_003958100 [Elysia marginata]|uniref:Uncharacterized protein n=1 Tax=Elysia marginata TaxID=1093978 RepID=A0AAV4FWA0_9GAST|nr:hypothetical protein ElyMa_003958100 [Elysia marginata]